MGFEHDVAIISDFRYKGGTSVSVASEVRAQHAAGYRTVLVPVRSPQLRRRRSFHPAIVACVQNGMATLALPGEPVRAKLVVIRPPAVFSALPDPGLRVRAGTVVVVANQVVRDGASRDGRPYYDVAAVDRHVREALEAPVSWAPIGPAVRASLEGAAAGVELRGEDWPNVLDPADWAAERTGFLADVPVVGRHSRPGWKKWPATAADVRAAYPTDGSVQVKLLGGGETAVAMLGEQPASWTLYPFGTRAPEEFLREIDFFVYFHHPEIREAFGRSIAEALAAGVPAIVSTDFEPLFGDACLYAGPGTAQALVRELRADPDRCEEQRARGRAFVEERLGFGVHEQRLRALAGPASAPRAPRPSSGRRVLFVSANGSGMGHLTRLLSLARRAPDGIEPVFATMSPAFRVVREAGYACEYVPRDRSWRGDRFNPLLERRLAEQLARTGASALVFDGTWPFDGLLAAARAAGVPMAWLRRGMWQAGAGEANLRRAGAFSLVIEPGELAAERDRGLTVAQREHVLSVAPIVQLDEDDLLDRAAARAELGLDPGADAALVMLGADEDQGLARLADAVARRCRSAGVQVVEARGLDSRRPGDGLAEVRRLVAHPVSRYLRAFDFAVAKSGYNAFHELLRFGVPAAFAPIARKLDDQWARASWAEAAGVGVLLDAAREQRAVQGLDALLDPARRAELARRTAALEPGNGAQEAMDAVAALAGVAPVVGARA